MFNCFFSNKNKTKISENVVFLHYLTTDNVGDLYSSPNRYFNLFKDCRESELFNYKFSSQDKIIIIGGGGLLQEYFQSSIENILKENEDKTIIFWGAGLDSTPQGNVFDITKISSADLIGLRDYNNQYSYVPCVSCMSDLFDKYRKKKPIQKVRCYIHPNYEFPDFLLRTFECYKNNQLYSNCSEMEMAINFLTGAEYIITNSFHGAYWAILLNRKVIALPFVKDGCKKFSEKFLTLKYKPLYISNFSDLENNFELFLKNAKNYTNALPDCRRANIVFYKKVLKIINNLYKS